MVDELDVLADCGVHADVARPPRAARVGDVNHPDIRVLRGSLRSEAIQPIRRTVGRPVIDEDCLKFVGRHALPEDRRDARLDVRPGVVGGDDDADLDGHSHPFGSA